MEYPDTRTGTFVSRPNRFIAMVDIGGTVHECHVKNTGRCKELLIPGAKVVLQEFRGGSRKTLFDLIAVYKGGMLINMDSQAPNRAFMEALPRLGLMGPGPDVFPERTHGDSRFDFYAEDGDRRAFIEVKGVTLEEDGVVLFPDAPTERGVKHLRGLERCVAEGFEAYAVFIVQMKGAVRFEPNYRMHREFGEALESAASAGVHVLAYDCIVTEDTMTVDSPVEVVLGGQSTSERMVS